MCYGFNSCHRNRNCETDSHSLKQHALSWRQPKDENFSDWTIKVKIGDETTTYYVHKNILGVGPKKSIYFNKLFRSEHVLEAQNSTSEISLPPSAASAFPIMLDYMYSKEDKLDIATENATALRHVSDYFYIPDLFEKVNDFIRKDVKTDNLLTYINEATLYNDEPLIYGLFNTVAGLGCDSESMSALIATYIHDQNLEISSDLFHSLTSYKSLPKISPECALFFAKLYEKYPSEKSNNSKESLLSRCAESFATYNDMSMFMVKTESFTEERNETNFNQRIYKSLSPETRVELLECALYLQVEKKKESEEKIDKSQCISISGAGIESVNGVYSFEEDDCYRKKGFWKDKMGYFVMTRQSRRCWYLSFRNRDGETHICSHNARNSSNTSSSNYGVLDRGWREVAGENSSPPTFRLH